MSRYDGLFSCEDSVVIVKTFKLVVIQLEEAEAVIRLINYVVEKLHSDLDWESVRDQVLNERISEIQVAIGRYLMDFYFDDLH